MKHLILFLIIALNLGCGDDTPVDSCKNSCGDYANCENGVCKPKLDIDFLNPATGKYERFLHVLYDELSNKNISSCFYYNLDMKDTPWVYPSYLFINSLGSYRGVEFSSIRVEKNTFNIYQSGTISSHRIKDITRDSKGLVTGFNILYFQEPNSFDDVIMNPNSIEVGTKTIVGSWVGKVNPTRDTIDFDIYIYRNRSNLLFEDSDTLKIVHRKYYKTPMNRADCKFCSSCE
jgi:hypothetical protein